MGDLIKIRSQIRVNNFAMLRVDQLVDLPHGVQRAAVFPIGILFGRQIGLKYRFENQNRRRFRYPIADCGNA